MIAPSEKSPESLAYEVAQALEARGIDYAFSGALAFGYWGVPRATRDIDVALYVDGSRADDVADALESAEVPVDRAQLRRRFEEGGIEVLWSGAIRVDLFLPSIAFEHEAARTRVRVPFARGEAWVVSAEALCVFKLLFFRPKDLVDVTNVVAVQGGRLDHAYVRRWLVEMMGEDDERVVRWDATVREFGSAAGS